MEIETKVIVTDGAHKDKVGILKEIRLGVSPYNKEDVKFDFYMIEVINEDGSTEILPLPIEQLKEYTE